MKGKRGIDRNVLFITGAAVLATLVVPVRTMSEPAPLPARMQPVAVDSGVLANPTNRAQVVFSKVIDLGPDVPWVRVLFDRQGTVLPPGSSIRVTSLLDGETQTLDAQELENWGYGTAFFNGSVFEVELIAGPTSRGNVLGIKDFFAGSAVSNTADTWVCVRVLDANADPLTSIECVKIPVDGSEHDIQFPDTGGFLTASWSVAIKVEEMGGATCQGDGDTCDAGDATQWQMTAKPSCNIPAFITEPDNILQVLITTPGETCDCDTKNGLVLVASKCCADRHFHWLRRNILTEVGVPCPRGDQRTSVHTINWLPCAGASASSSPGGICPATGACCLDDGGACVEGTAQFCTDPDVAGVYFGDNTTCAPGEGCRFPDGSCLERDPRCCENAGGTSQGPGSTVSGECVPTVSQWDLIALALVLLTAGTIMMRHRHAYSPA